MPAPRDHANELVALQADRVSVFGLEFVDEAFVGVARVLRDFLDERFVIQPMNGFELPGLRSDLEFQRRLMAHDLCPYPWMVCPSERLFQILRECFCDG